ncbi:MAG: hypothetical protein ACE5HI_13325 [bacterium]
MVMMFVSLLALAILFTFLLSLSMMRMTTAAAHAPMTPMHEKHQQGKYEDID